MKKGILLVAALCVIAIIAIAVPRHAESPLLHSEEALIVGTWTSEDDARYTVAYKPDGTLTERYDSKGLDDVETHGTWTIDRSGDDPYLVTYLDDEYHYAIVSLTENEMTIRLDTASRDNHFIKTSPRQ